MLETCVAKGIVCSLCDEYRVLKASSDICCICALQWALNKKELTEEQIEGIDKYCESGNIEETPKPEFTMKISTLELLRRRRNDT